MKTFKRTLWLLVLFLALGVHSAFAMGDWYEDFGPYAENEKPAPVTLEPLVARSRTTLGCNTSAEYGLKNSPAQFLLKIDGSQDDQKKSKLVIQLTQPDPLPDLKLEIPDAADAYSVYTADLNGDGKPDYIISYVHITPDQAQGKGSDEDEDNSYQANGQNILFLMSSGNVMTAYSLNNCNLEEDGFVKVPGSDQVQYVTLKIIKNHGVKPKYKYHSLLFLLFRPVVFDKTGEVKPPDTQEPRFPKFVSFFENSDRKNHKETALLTADQKKDLLAKNPLDITKLNPDVKDKTPAPKKKKKKKHKVI
jgi:hypothetical protein